MTTALIHHSHKMLTSLSPAQHHQGRTHLIPIFGVLAFRLWMIL